MRSHVDHSHRIAHTVVSFKFVWHRNYLSCPLTMLKNHNGYWLVLIDNLENNLEKSTFHKQHLQPQKKLIRLLFWCTCPVMFLHIIISTICHTCMVFHPVLFGGKKWKLHWQFCDQKPLEIAQMHMESYRYLYILMHFYKFIICPYHLFFHRGITFLYMDKNILVKKFVLH